MIVVVGTPAWNPGPPPAPAGRACAIALAAAARGAAVELVGRAGDDPAGDALMIALAAAGVGHVALLRDPARPTPVIALPSALAGADDAEPSLLGEDDEPLDGGAAAGAATTVASPGLPGNAPVLEPADVSLALRYITSYAVVVVTDDVEPAVVAVAAEAAAFAGAHLLALVGADGAIPDDLPTSAAVFAAPAAGPDDAFALLVGSYAASIDAGASPDAAFTAARGAWEAPAS